jgi:hypothetical protein
MAARSFIQSLLARFTRKAERQTVYFGQPGGGNGADLYSDDGRLIASASGVAAGNAAFAVTPSGRAVPVNALSEDSLEAKAAQAAKELGAVLRVGAALEMDDLPIIRRRLDEVVMATNEVIRACENKHAATNRKE